MSADSVKRKPATKVAHRSSGASVFRLPPGTQEGIAQRVEGYPSGQRGQTVNLLANAYGGSNPPPSTSLRSEAYVKHHAPELRLGKPIRVKDVRRSP